MSFLCMISKNAPLPDKLNIHVYTLHVYIYITEFEIPEPRDAEVFFAGET